MNPDLATNPQGGVPAEPEVVEAQVQGDETQELDPETGEPLVTQAVDDTEEIDHEGQKLKIPKALKGAFLMHADYTRKTQEVAEARRTVEEQATALKQQAEMHQAFLSDVGTITALDRAIDQYKQTDWRALQAQSPEQAQARWMEYMQLKDARDTAASELSAKVNKRQQDAAAETAKRQTELRTSLARDIPGYTPELATKMQTFGVSAYGFTPAEIAATTDARLHRLMHDAMIGRQLQEKAAKATAAAKTAQTAEAAKPPAQVNTRSQATRINPASKDGERLDADEWMRRRNEQLRSANR